MEYEDYLRMLAEVAGYKNHEGAQGAVDAALLAKNDRWRDSLPRYLKMECFMNEADTNPFLPGPGDDEVCKGDIEIGRVVRGPALGGPFRLPFLLVGEHQLWTGHSGSGKSFGIMSEILHLIGTVPVWIFDTEDEYKNLAQFFPAEDLLVVDYKDLRRNIFEPPPGFHPLEWQGRVKNIWRESFFLRDGSVNLLGDILHELYLSKGILDGSTNYVTLNEFYRKLSSLRFRVNSRNAGYWETLVNRTLNLLNFMGQTYNCVRGHDLEFLLSKSVIFRLRGLSDDLFAFFANDMLTYVLASREPLLNCELRNVFVFDEGHRLFSPLRADRYDLGEPIAFQAVRTIRKRGVGLIIGDQVPHLLPQAIRANLGTRVILRLVDGNSLRAIGDSLSLTPEQRGYILELPKRQAIVQYSGYPKPFLIELPELGLTEPIGERAVEERGRQISSVPGFRGEEQDEPKDPKAPTGRPSRLTEPISLEAIEYLKEISKSVFLPITKRDKALGKSGWKGNALREELTNKGLVRLVKINTHAKGGVITVAEITEKGYELLDRLKVKYEKPRGKGGLEHRFWQAVITDWGRRHGYNAAIEDFRNGKSVDVGLEIDGRSVACEIVITGEQKELFNLGKDSMAGWDEIWFCCSDERVAAKIRELILSFTPADKHAEVRFKLLAHFL